MEDILKVIILALIEGITEFLPISSTGHLIVGTSLLNFNAMGAVFEIFIQSGAVIAVILYYRATFREHLKNGRTDPKISRFWFLILVAFVPAVGLGFLFERQIETILFSPMVVGVSLIVGGIAFLIVERLPQIQQATEATSKADITDITLKQAVIVGLVQVLALIPGMSRSGTSIVGGMLSGMNRRVATEFSFFLAIPTLGGATVYKFMKSFNDLGGNDLILLAIGALMSGIFAWFAIDWLLRYISRNNFIIFGYYRIIAGTVIILLILANVIA